MSTDLLPKPFAYTNAQLDELVERMQKGWAFHRFHLEPLLAMARERNELMAEKLKSVEAQQKALAAAYGGI